MYTCGQEANNIMDVYQAAVQQGGRTYGTTKPQAISEYGHWEYGGFTGTSNQPRSAGEAGLLILAGNQASAMSQDHALSWLAVDGVWVWNDYFGFAQYTGSLCSGGVVDMFRIPKFGYYFYQSQRDPNLNVPGVKSGPMVFIASYWTAQSALTVRIYSNCQQVSLYLNDTLVSTKSPEVLANIEHPPFTFAVSSFTPGTLRADGLIGGTVRATHEVKTPGTAASVKIIIDTANMSLVADGADLALVYASIVDASGTVVPGAANAVTFSANGPGTIVSGDGNPVTAVAGIAAAYVQTGYDTPGLITVTGATEGLTSGSATVRSVPMPVNPNSAIKPLLPAAEGNGRRPAVVSLHGRILSINPGIVAAATITFHDARGRLVYKKQLGTALSVDLSALSPGWYHTAVKAGKRIWNEPVMLTKK
jgi:hypothetical protein